MKLIQPLSLGFLIATSLAATATATPHFSSTQKQAAEVAPLGNRSLQQTRPSHGNPSGSEILRDRCPEGQVPSSWQKPIYDDQGLFVVGWETVATCIPAGLKPAG